MKILHIGEYVSGGVATYLRTLLSAPASASISYYLILSDKNSEKDWPLATDRVFYYHYKRGIFQLVKAMRMMRRYIDEIQPDIVHIHSTWAGFYVRTPYLWRRKTAKIVYSPHGWSFLMDFSPVKKKIYAFIERILSDVTDQIINVSNFEQEQAARIGINPKKMMMIYNGVEESSGDDQEEVSFSQEKINLLFVGRIDHSKGLDILLRVYERYPFTNLHLYVIGASILDHKVLRSSEKVTYLGWIHHSKLDAYYRACDAVVMPSRSEGFGLAAIEAMRNRKAVIASNRGALPELVNDGMNGYIFSLDDEDALAGLLARLEKVQLAVMGAKGYERYKKLFTAIVMCRQTEELYRAVQLNGHI